MIISVRLKLIKYVRFPTYILFYCLQYRSYALVVVCSFPLCLSNLIEIAFICGIYSERPSCQRMCTVFNDSNAEGWLNEFKLGHKERER